MKNMFVRVSAFLVALVLLVSALPIVSNAATTSYSKTSNSGERDEICTSLDGTSALSYYTGSNTYDNLSNMSQSSLLSSLRTLMTSTHKYTSSYNDCKNYADKTDCENNNGKVLLIYTSYSATMSQWNGWNREHVWPQSLGGGNTSGGGADLHHIRPSDAVVNSTRGNKKYGYANGGKAVSGNNPATGYAGGNYGTYFEPLDNVKGDVARICLYVHVRWGSAWGADSVTEVFQSVDVLLEWCELDPVDTWEMGRNEVVQNIQGNRNVFIDYPELAWTLFGREVPEGMTTPSGEANGTSGGSSSDGSCNHASTELRGVVTANCGTGGYTGDTYCVACGELVRKGSNTSATGAHIFGAWVFNGTDKDSRTCNVCNKTETRAHVTNCKHESTELRNVVVASCSSPGYTGDICCTECDAVIVSGAAKDPTSEHKNTAIKGEIAATCEKTGYSGDVRCADCDALIEQGTETPIGDHSWSEYTGITLSSGRVMMVRSCTVCALEDIRYDDSNAPFDDDSYIEEFLICSAGALVVTVCVAGVIIIAKKKKH